MEEFRAQYNFNKSVLKIRYRNSAVFPPPLGAVRLVECGRIVLPVILKIKPHFKQIYSSLIFQNPTLFFLKVWWSFVSAKLKSTLFQIKPEVRVYVGVDFPFTTTKGHKTIRKIEEWF